MRNGNSVAVIIPALNEEKAIGNVLAAIPEWIDDVVLVDNGSTDNTPTIAASHGARVVLEPRRGYGSACLTGIETLENPDIVVFMDGDFSDYPEEAGLLVDPIVADRADMVIGSRVLGNRETGALTPQAVFGNWLSCKLMALLWGTKFTDLGPFRAIRFTALQRLGMRDPGYGWTVEMQIKAVLAGLTVQEVPVSYRRRIGKSKISGTIRGIVGAGIKILGTIFLAAMGAYNKRRTT
jgi:glycosyltransferase involved in cell wall biosynthesis